MTLDSKESVKKIGNVMVQVRGQDKLKNGKYEHGQPRETWQMWRLYGAVPRWTALPLPVIIGTKLYARYYVHCFTQ